MKKILLTIGMVFLLSLNAHAVTMYVGDADGFGFGDAMGYNAANGAPADINGNGVLDAGDGLPSINGDKWVATGKGDDFDFRSSSEAASSNGAQFTDVALSTSYSSRPGLAKNASFTFNFSIDTSDPYYGQDHFINLVYGDYDVRPMKAVVEGNTVDLLGNNNAQLDGAIWRAYVEVAWADMLDGEVTIDILAPNEPYVAFDYALLDTKALPTAPTPEPGTILLLGAGLLGIVGYRRKFRK